MTYRNEAERIAEAKRVKSQISSAPTARIRGPPTPMISISGALSFKVRIRLDAWRSADASPTTKSIFLPPMAIDSTSLCGNYQIIPPILFYLVKNSVN